VNRTQRTLLEQMQITDYDIKRRMELLNLSTDALVLLASHKTIIENNIDEIVDEFYQKQTTIDEISLLIGDAETLQRLRDAQRTYVIDLFGGYYDIEYVNNRLRIGMVHKRIGVDPKLYLSAVSSLKDIIFNTLRANIDDEIKLIDSLNALDKLFYFDVTLVFDTYIDSLVGEIEAARNRTEIYAKNLEGQVAERTKQLEEQAKIDPLTNIYNQRAMQDLMRKEMSLAKRRRYPVSLLYFDVDKFKDINDKYGHQKGDEVLRNIGVSLTKVIRETDVACRYGGDEFCVILPECDINNAEEIAQKIVDDFSAKYKDNFTLSIGISNTGPEEFVSGDELIRSADKKMYLAKEKDGFQIIL